jgi:hypothetical protein
MPGAHANGVCFLFVIPDRESAFACHPERSEGPAWQLLLFLPFCLSFFAQRRIYFYFFDTSVYH